MPGLRETLYLLRPDPPIPASAADSVCAALGAALLVLDLPDTGWLAPSMLAAAHLGPRGVGLVDAIPDRSAWKGGLAHRVLHPVHAGASLSVLWLAFRAFDACGDAVSAGALEGVEALVRSALAAEAARGPIHDELLHAVVGLAAGLELAGGDAREELEAHAIDVWDRLRPTEVASPFEGAVHDGELCRLLALHPLPKAPLLALALRTIAGRAVLPASPEDLFRALTPQ
jgi:hypothetical protein